MDRLHEIVARLIDRGPSVSTILLSIMVVLFSFVPVLFLLIQQKGIRRQQNVLSTVPDRLRNTILWRRANQILARRHFTASRKAKPATAAADRSSTVAYLASLVLVSLIMFSCWSCLLGQPFGIDWYVASKNLFLLGTQVPDGGRTFQQIQEATLAASCVAFAIAYVVVVNRMAVRLNINEFNALENLFDAVHMITAIIVATVGTTVLTLLGLPLILVTLFALVTGLRPDFYLQTLGRAAYRTLTAAGGPFAGLRSAEAPTIGSDRLPPTVPLQTIDGVSDDVADRLVRIDIASCHRLAFHNPFVIWVRTSFLLPEIVDWTGQALLWAYCGDRIVELRAERIRTIDDLLNALELGRPLTALALDPAEAQRLAAQLVAVPQILAVRDLSRALLEARPPAEAA